LGPTSFHCLRNGRRISFGIVVSENRWIEFRNLPLCRCSIRQLCDSCFWLPRPALLDGEGGGSLLWDSLYPPVIRFRIFLLLRFVGWASQCSRWFRVSRTLSKKPFWGVEETHEILFPPPPLLESQLRIGKSGKAYSWLLSYRVNNYRS
jgi:hypothetical protein